MIGQSKKILFREAGSNKIMFLMQKSSFLSKVWISYTFLIL